jgi:hypothetical protein
METVLILESIDKEILSVIPSTKQAKEGGDDTVVRTVERHSLQLLEQHTTVCRVLAPASMM